MGRGNFAASGNFAEQWYIDNDMYFLETESEDDCPEFDGWLFEHDINLIRQKITKKFQSFWNKDCWTRDGHTILQNRLFEIGYAHEDSYVAIFIHEVDDGELLQFAAKHFDTYSSFIEGLLLDMYGSIGKRCTAWTSCTITR